MTMEQDPISQDLARTAPTGLGWISFAGFVIIGVFVAGFMVWASLAPLSGAIVASGTVSAGGNNQFIQHLEGGIISEVVVHEGQQVKAGDVLMVLDDTAAKVNRNRLTRQLIALQARAARLEAERDRKEKFDPEEQLLADARSEDALSIVEEQEMEFKARRERFITERRILDQRVQALDESMIGLEAQIEAGRKQLAVVEEERQRKRDLLEEGLAIRSQYTDLLRSEAALTGQNSNLVASLASMKIQRIEAVEQIERNRSQAVETAVSELNTLRTQIADIEEQVRQAEDILQRTGITAPTAGTVVQILRNTPGSVVRAGENLIEILPQTEQLIVEIRISPMDKDAISIGQKAELHFSSLNRRTTPEIEAVVRYISADRLIDPVNNVPYFNARLHMEDELPPEIKPDQIFAGMPVEAFISTESRTFVEYLIQPIKDSLKRAFNEE